MVIQLLMVFIGFSEGLIVGSATVAFITLLDILPRLAQITETQRQIRVYESMIILAGVVVPMASSLGVFILGANTLTITVGLLMGVFIGLTAAALAEVTNVIPVLSSRLKLENHVGYILAAIVGGKVLGSLIYWIFIVK